MKIKKRIFSLALAGALALGLVPAFSMTALADGDTSTYTLTIPSTLTVADKGWNATDGISATGTLASGKKLTVTASSANSWALKQQDSSETVGYTMKETSAGEAKTAWEFTTLPGSATLGIDVADYSSKPAGTYQDTVTFTVKVEDAAVVKTLSVGNMTLNYCDGDTWQQIAGRNPDKIHTVSNGGWEVRIAQIGQGFEGTILCKGSTGNSKLVYADHVVDPNATYVWWE